MSDIDIKNKNNLSAFLMMKTSPIIFPLIYGFKFISYYLGFSDGMKMKIYLSDKYINNENNELKKFLENKGIKNDEIDNYIKEIRKII